MLATRTPIAGILVAMLVLVGEVVSMKVYVADHQPTAPTIAVKPTPDISAPHFGRHRGCADRLKISGPDDLAQPAR